MLDFLNKLKLTNMHYIGIAVGVAAALFLVYYFFLRGSGVPQGAPAEMPPGAPLYKDYEHYEDMSDHGEEDYGEMPDLEPVDPQQLQMEQQQMEQQQMQQQQPVAHGDYQQEQFQGGGEPMAANAGAGGFQSW